MKQIFLAILLFCAAVPMAFGQIIPPNPVFSVSEKATGSVLRDGVYMLHYKCTAKPVSTPISQSSRTLWGLLFPMIPDTTSFGFFITPKDLLTAASISTLAGTDIMAAQVVYVDDHGTAPKSIYNTSCEGSILFSGNTTPKLILFGGAIDETKKELIKGIATLLSQIVSPIYSLVWGSKIIPDLDKNTLDNTVAVMNAYAEFLDLFKDDATFAAPFPIKTGRYIAKTRFADVTITVTREDSLVTGDAKFLQPVVDLLSTKPTRFVAADFPATGTEEQLNAAMDTMRLKCDSTIGDWQTVGLRDPIDLAYVLYRTIAGNFSPSLKQLLNCLGRNYSLPVAIRTTPPFPLPARLTFTPDDIVALDQNRSFTNDEDGVQPTVWNTVKQIGEDFTNLTSSITQGGDVHGNRLKKYYNIFEDSIVLDDATADYRIIKALDATAATSEDRLKLPLATALSALKNAGFDRWACFATAGGATSFRSERHADSLTMLVWKNAGNAATLRADDAIGVRVLFHGFNIARLVFTDDVSKLGLMQNSCPAKIAPQ